MPNIAQFVPAAGKFQPENPAGTPQPLDVGVQFQNAALRDVQAFKNAVTPVYHVIIQRKQHKAGIAAQSPQPMIIKDKHLVFPGPGLPAQTPDPFFRVQFRQHLQALFLRCPGSTLN